MRKTAKDSGNMVQVCIYFLSKMIPWTAIVLLDCVGYLWKLNVVMYIFNFFFDILGLLMQPWFTKCYNQDWHRWTVETRWTLITNTSNGLSSVLVEKLLNHYNTYLATILLSHFNIIPQLRIPFHFTFYKFAANMT